MYKFGSVKIIPIIDALTEVPLDSMFDKGADTTRFKNLLTKEGLYQIPMGGYYIEFAGLKILIDTGNGLPAISPAFGHLLENMEKNHIKPADITHIIITHMHLDHIGWLSNENKSIFPNAKIILHSADIEYFSEHDFVFPGCISTKERLKPVQNQLLKIDKDYTLTKGFEIKHAPGHTPGELMVDIHTDGKRVLILGDVIHHPAELVDPTWIFIAQGSDVNPELARKTKAIWVEEAAKDNTFVTAAHFPLMKFGRVVTKNGVKSYEVIEPEN